MQFLWQEHHRERAGLQQETWGKNVLFCERKSIHPQKTFGEPRSQYTKQMVYKVRKNRIFMANLFLHALELVNLISTLSNEAVLDSVDSWLNKMTIAATAVWAVWRLQACTFSFGLSVHQILIVWLNTLLKKSYYLFIWESWMDGGILNLLCLSLASKVFLY